MVFLLHLFFLELIFTDKLYLLVHLDPIKMTIKTNCCNSHGSLGVEGSLTGQAVPEAYSSEPQELQFYDSRP